MQLSFQDKNIRKICEDQDAASAVYGDAVAETLVKRLADLDAAASASDVPAGNPEVFPFDTGPVFKLDLSGGYRLIFCANHVKNNHTVNDQIDWSKVHRIKILKIELANE